MTERDVGPEASERASGPPVAAKPAASRWRRMAIEALVVVAAFLVIRAWNGRALAARPPDPQLTLADGTRVEIGGRPLVVHFFASWCGVCRAEEGSVAALARDHDVVLVASQSGDAARVGRYLEEHGLSDIPVVLDPSGDAAERWGVSAFPATFYVDSGGEIDFAEVGYTTELGMRARAALTR